MTGRLAAHQQTVWQRLPDDHAALEPRGVHVLRVSLARHRWPTLTSHDPLSHDERLRAARYVVEPPRQRFLLCRRALRFCLGWLTETSPAAIAFATERNAKPILSHPANTSLVFNVSHTGDWGVIAFAWHRQLGVDIESLDPQLDHAGMAQRFFSEDERRQFAGFPVEKQVAAFYRLWTSKEAYMKAVGLGMALPLGSFSMEGDPHLPPGLVGGDIREGPWQAISFDVADDVTGTLLWDRGPTSVSFWDAPAAW